ICNLTYVFSLYCSNPEVERCQQEPYVLNAMARGQSSALSVVAKPGGAPPAYSLEVTPPLDFPACGTFLPEPNFFRRCRGREWPKCSGCLPMIQSRSPSWGVEFC